MSNESEQYMHGPSGPDRREFQEYYPSMQTTSFPMNSDSSPSPYIPSSPELMVQTPYAPAVQEEVTLNELYDAIVTLSGSGEQSLHPSMHPQFMPSTSSSLAHALDPVSRSRPTLPRLQIYEAAPSFAVEDVACNMMPLESGLASDTMMMSPSPPASLAIHAPPAPEPGIRHTRNRSASAVFITSPVTTSPDSLSSFDSSLLVPDVQSHFHRSRSVGSRGQHSRTYSESHLPSAISDFLTPEWRGRDRARTVSNDGYGAARSPSSGSSRRSSPYPISRSVSPGLSVGGWSDADSIPVTPISQGASSPIDDGADDADTVPSSSQQSSAAETKPIVKNVVTSDKVAAASRRRRRTDADPPRFQCDHCGRYLTSKHNLDGHLRSHTDERPFLCSYSPCDKRFSRKSDKKRHEETVHNNIYLKCQHCPAVFSRKDALVKHSKTCGPVDSSSARDFRMRE